MIIKYFNYIWYILILIYYKDSKCKVRNVLPYCLVFFETKSTNGKEKNQLHIEKINDILDKDIQEIDNVLVIWCAKGETNDFTSVVGWYKNATVYRYYQEFEFDSGFIQDYNVLAKVEDCVLLPPSLRSRRIL